MVVLGQLTVLKVVLCWVSWGPYILVDGLASRIQISCPQLKHARLGIYPTELTTQYLMPIPHDNIPQAPPNLNMLVQYLIPIPHWSTQCKHAGPIIHPTKHNWPKYSYNISYQSHTALLGIDPPYINMPVQPLRALPSPTYCHGSLMDSNGTFFWHGTEHCLLVLLDFFPTGFVQNTSDSIGIMHWTSLESDGVWCV